MNISPDITYDHFAKNEGELTTEQINNDSVLSL